MENIIVRKRRPSKLELRNALKIDLYLTHNCNFRCLYCYLGEKQNKIVSDDTLNSAIEFVNNNFNDEKFIFLTFIGGEPLLQKNQIINVANKIHKNYPNLRERVHFNIVTNGYLLDDDFIEFLKRNYFYMVFSIDGSRDTQDHNRRLGNGHGTFDKVYKNLQKCRENIKSLTVRMTVHPDNISNLARDVEFMMSTGCHSIGFVPAYEEDWNPINIGKFKENLIEILGIWNNKLKEKEVLLTPLLNYLQELDDGKPVSRWYMHECQLLSKKRYSIDVDGKIYPCHRFVAFDKNRSKFEIGHLDGGIESQKEKKFYEELEKLKEITPLYAGCPALNYELDEKSISRESIYQKFSEAYKGAVAHFYENIKQYEHLEELKTYSALSDKQQASVIRPFGKDYDFFISYSKPTEFVEKTHAIYGSGVSTDVSEAKKKSAYEAEERNRLFCYDLNAQPFVSYDEILDKSLDPTLFIPLGEENRRFKGFNYRAFDHSKKLHWTKAINITNSEEVFIPSFSVYAKYFYALPEEQFYHHTSTGSAIHNTKERAILNGIFEIVERDALMNRWYAQMPPCQINIGSIDDPRFEEIKKIIASLDCELKVNLLTLDIPVFVASASLISKEKAPFFALGCSASENVIDSIVKSAYEALQIRFLQSKNIGCGLLSRSEVKSLADHALYHIHNDHRKELLKWTTSGVRIDVEQCAGITKIKSVRDAVEYFKKNKGADIYCTHLSHNVIKTCIPEMVPLNCEHFGVPLGNKRLHSFLDAKSGNNLHDSQFLPHPLP